MFFSKIWRDVVKKVEWNFVRQDYTKILGQKERGGDETTLIGVCAQIEVHTTHFSLHMQFGSSQRSLGDSIKLSFSFWRVTKKPLHHDRDIDHTIVVFRFSEPPQFLNTPNWGNLSFHDKRQCIEFVALRPAPPWAAPLVKLNNSTSQTSVSSRLCFHLASLRVRFSIRALPSIPQFIISFQTTPHLLSKNRWREPRWLYLPVCLFSLPCHWVVFPQIFVFSTTFFLIFNTDHWIFQVQLHRLKLPNLCSNFLSRVEIKRQNKRNENMMMFSKFLWCFELSLLFSCF